MRSEIPRTRKYEAERVGIRIFHNLFRKILSIKRFSFGFDNGFPFPDSLMLKITRLKEINYTTTTNTTYT